MIFSVVFFCGKKDNLGIEYCKWFGKCLTNLNEGHKLADQEPDVEQLEVGGGWEDLPHVDDDCGQHQHGGQVHTQGSFKEGWFEEHKSSIGKKLF